MQLVHPTGAGVKNLDDNNSLEVVGVKEEELWRLCSNVLALSRTNHKLPIVELQLLGHPSYDIKRIYVRIIVSGKVLTVMS